MKVFLALLGLLPLSSLAQTPRLDSLTSELRQVAAASRLPGFGVAVVTADSIWYEQGFGYANRQIQQPYQATTIQNVGSVSKTVIGVALLKAVEQGLFTLDTPINNLLPFAVQHPQAPAQPITIRQLATHTSGILDRPAAYRKAYIPRSAAATPISQREAAASQKLAAFLRAYLSTDGREYRPANFSPEKPGNAYHYSNIGAALAAYVIEVKAGMSFAEYTRRYLFEPLGMRDSGWFYEPDRADRYAANYKANGRPYPPYALITYPDGGLLSTPHDLALYLRAIVRGAAGRPSALLSSSSFQTLLSPQFTAPDFPTLLDPKEPNAGIFWAIRRNGQVGHTGGDPGASAFFFFDPKTGLGKIFTTNVLLESDAALPPQFSRIWQLLDRAAPPQR